jgi:hypothetical protein
MRLTARQREFARIAGWALPISVALGAVFGHFHAQNGGVWGAVTAIVISCTILLLEVAVFSCVASGRRKALDRPAPFARRKPKSSSMRLPPLYQ